jgi:hypothetical protein
MRKDLTATYDHDSNGYHRFRVDRGQGLTGTLCVPKTEPVLDTITIGLRTKAEAEQKPSEP